MSSPHSRRVDETDDHYDNQYNTHLQRIQNTQQSWNRSGYYIPPHIHQDQGNIPGTNPPEETHAKPTRIHPPPLGWVHPRTMVNACHWGEMIRAIQEMNMNIINTQVQLESASWPYPLNQNSEAPPEEYHNSGPGGISAYRVTHGEQYHYTVLIKCICQLVHWELALLRISELGQQGITSIMPRWLFNHLTFHYATTLGKTSTIEVFPFMIYSSLHNLQWP